MERLGLGLLVAALGLGLAVLIFQNWRANRVRAAARASYFDACKSLLADRRRGEGAAGFTRLSGSYRGQSFDLQAVPDTLTFRKLPALWVLVTLPAPLPLSATLNLMIRPTGVEPFSNFHRLPDQIAPPAGYPADCAIRTDDLDGLLPEAFLRQHLRLFDDERVKELVMSPKGLRVTVLAEEANRGRYLIFRDSEMGQTQLSPDRLKPYLDALLGLRADILSYNSPAKESLIA